MIGQNSTNSYYVVLLLLVVVLLHFSSPSLSLLDMHELCELQSIIQHRELSSLLLLFLLPVT